MLTVSRKIAELIIAEQEIQKNIPFQLPGYDFNQCWSQIAENLQSALRIQRSWTSAAERRGRSLKEIPTDLDELQKASDKGLSVDIVRIQTLLRPVLYTLYRDAVCDYLVEKAPTIHAAFKETSKEYYRLLYQLERAELRHCKV
jgi:hypothetical protein